MDGREGMAVSGSASYYLNRGVNDSGSGFGSVSVSGSVTPTGLPAPSGYKPFSILDSSFHSHVRGSSLGSTFQVQNPAANSPSGINVPVTTGGSSSDPVRKKRGRPRKYGPDGANMSLGLSPMSSMPFHGSITPSPKRSRGRPRGSGWKQKLAPLGEWMNSSAGLAFTPHVIHIRVGEDIATKILSFAQHRPRALCVLSANGTVSAVTLRQPSGSTVTYEGHFDILCLSGSYLVGESGEPRNRTGGLSISVCHPDGHAIGGAIGGRLTAASPVQVVVCSFVYGGLRTTDKTEASSRDDREAVVRQVEKSSAPTSAGPSQNLTPNSLIGIWPPGPQPDQKYPHTEIDLTRG